MKIVLGPDSYKDALSASAACAAISQGIRRVSPDAHIVTCPIADGGEGFVETLLQVPGAQEMNAAVHGPYCSMPPVDARWALLNEGRTGVVELAQAAGLELVPPHQRDPTQTTTYGVGSLIAAALDHNVSSILLGVGGSATNDAGCGIAQALGVVFLDQDGQPITEPITGGRLVQIRQIDISDLDRRLMNTSIRVACDVTNPLHGPNGAAHIYAPQKGATPEQVQTLDHGLQNIESVWRRLGLLPNDMRGFGAAGGAAGGAACMLGAALAPGANLVLDAIGFDRHVKDARLVLTGEGRLDGQSLSGKAVLAVAQRAAKYGVPTIALVGSASEDADACLAAGLHGYEILAPGLSTEQSIARTAELLTDAAERVVRRFVP